MEYADPDPSNAEYVLEVNRRRNFNNFHTRLPWTETVPRFGGLEGAVADYRERVSDGFKPIDLQHLPEENQERIAVLIEKMVADYQVNEWPILNEIDNFIAASGLNYQSLRDKCLSEDDTWNVGVKDIQQDLIPLYIHLRKKGFSEKDIVR